MISNLKSGPRVWLRRFVWLAASFVVLVVIGYFVLTSQAFLKAAVLPRVSQALQADLRVTTLRLAPFSRLELEGVRLDIGGAEPLLTTERLLVRYRLGSFLRGTPVIDEVTVVNPRIEVQVAADGTSALDRWLQRLASPTPPQAPPAGTPLSPPAVAIRNVRVTGGVLRHVTAGSQGAAQAVELSNVSFSLDRIENAQPAAAQITGDLVFTSLGTNQIAVRLEGGADLKLSAALGMDSVQGRLRAGVGRATGAFADAAGLSAALACGLVPGELRETTVRVERAGQPLCNLRIAGPLDLVKQEGRLTLELEGLDRHVLHLVTAAHGVDVGKTRLTLTNRVDFSPNRLGLSGVLTGREVSLRAGSRTTPEAELGFAYAVTMDLEKRSAVLTRADFSLRQQGQAKVMSGLDAPMTLHWGGVSPSAADSRFRFSVRDLRLEEWVAPLLEQPVRGGVSADATIAAVRNGRELRFDFKGGVAGLSVPALPGSREPLGVRIETAGSMEDLQKLELTALSVALEQGNRALFTTTARGTAQTAPANLDVRVQATGRLAPLLSLLTNLAWITFDGGIAADTRIRWTNETAGITGRVALTNLTGKAQGLQLERAFASADLNLSATRQGHIQLQQAHFDFGDRDLDAGGITLSGSWQGTNAPARWVARGDIDHVLLRPLVTAVVADAGVRSGRIEFDSELSYSPQSSRLRSELSVTNLLVTRAQVSSPTGPVSLRARLDSGCDGHQAWVKSLDVFLEPSARAPNSLSVTGRLDMARTDALEGAISLRSAGLDLTRWLDAFGPTSTATNVSAAAAPAATPPAGEETEPEAMSLPIRDLVFDARLDRLWLRSLSVTNFVFAGRITNQVVRLDMVQAAVAGAPVQGRGAIELGRKGYAYEAVLRAQAVPLEPIVDAFAPAYRGRYQGAMYADLDVRGAGVTGRSLKQSLSGQANLVFTNANIQMVRPTSRAILMPIAVLLKAPDVLDSPLDDLAGQLRFGGGEIRLESFLMRSPAFQGSTRGTIRIADRLADSPLDLPLDIRLRPSIARKSGLVRDDASTNQAFVALPRFAYVRGTFGQPRTDTDKAVIAGLLLRSTANLPGIATQKSGDLIQGIGDLLIGGGGKERPANPSTQPVVPTAPTNAAPAKRNPLSSLLDTVTGILDQAVGATATPPTTPASPAGAPAPAKPAPQPSAPVPTNNPPKP